MLDTIWFILIAVLWIGYLFLEGFDLGIGILLRALGRTDKERRLMINTIGPVWDGNEVWLLTAGGATFAAFPKWYASLFSTLYLPLTLVLVALIFRAVAFEYRGKGVSETWRNFWDWALMLGSLVAAGGVGAMLALSTTGLPINANGDRAEGPIVGAILYGLLGAAAVIGFAVAQGLAFLSLKTEGEIRVRARAWLKKGILPLAAPAAVWAILLGIKTADVVGLLLVVVAAAALVFAFMMARAEQEMKTFLGLAGFLVAGVSSIFVSAYPVVLPSTIDPAFNLTVENASSSPYTLAVMTGVAAFGVPLVLAYQAWTYWVFRKRLHVDHLPELHDFPAQVLSGTASGKR
ncbi:cytochrome d ubiquinol oxidase subunit II [Falsarthrobacter nasiphocae]|uniref:Cytochrome d ubiquinol oxidase subunit II n=1 Tax=Falsarthrobacter nasiphocae TaxID=189863 RepID=A0AAE4C4E4_9MICC|nr:cytochrome d ubiquinol oxidase subunit II [Falsarthrobacter nasiphocae]MDR6891276.1 cytochrome d ubiquinol oxidase subunit II [Falsarthrobacter nasiphocae]